MTTPHAEKAPTMIIPSGTDIHVDVHGQLSIRTPGNLVIQDSGSFATLESVNGSIRIESDAQVEAVTVQCAEACYVEGSLTAWRVKAQSIQLEQAAKANIVFQEADRLEVGQNARLVGNFSTEKELFLLFSRFANELRSLPLFSERRKVQGETESDEEQGDERLLADVASVSPEVIEANSPPAEPASAPETQEIEVEPAPEAPSPAKPQAPKSDEPLPDPLFYSLVILEREYTRPSYGPTAQRAIEEVVKLLRDRDLETLGLTFRTLFGRIVEPGRDVQRVEELLERHFDGDNGD
ncbi:MAG: hypothetical protein ACE5GX_14785 [Thermoanaerobaculia bacterium]